MVLLIENTALLQLKNQDTCVNAWNYGRNIWKMLYLLRCWVLFFKIPIMSTYCFSKWKKKFFLLRIQQYNVGKCLKDTFSILIAELLIESLNGWLLQYETSFACLGNFCSLEQNIKCSIPTRSNSSSTFQNHLFNFFFL